MKILKLKPNEMITIERDREPGRIHHCLVFRATDDGFFKLVLQDSYERRPGQSALSDYMYDNNVTQANLATILGTSRATISRYLNGHRKVPLEVFTKLGIIVDKSPLETLQYQQELANIASGFRTLVDEMDKLTKEED